MLRTPLARFGAALVLVGGLVLADKVHAATGIDPKTGAVEPGSSLAMNSAKHGFDLSQLDPVIAACQNFYQYAQGGYLKTHPTTPSKSSVGQFADLADRNLAVVHTILDEAAAMPNAKVGSPEQKIGDVYGSCMNTAARDAAGITPIKPLLDLASGVTSSADLPAVVATLQNSGVGSFFTAGGSTDPNDSNKIIAQIAQGGLGLPERNYYLDTDAQAVKTRDAYQAHVGRTFALIGDDQATAAKEAAAVMSIETALAKASKSNFELRNPLTRVHPTTVAELPALTPHFDWAAYFKDRGMPAFTTLNDVTPDFFKSEDAVFASTTGDDLRSYLRWHVVDRYAPSLTTALETEAFSFSGTVLSGTKEQRPQWERCARITDSMLGDALGQDYVKRNFPPASRARAQELVKNVIAALREDLTTLDWMSPATRTEAIAKLDALGVKIGYPNKWKTYADLPVTRTSFAGDLVLAANVNSKHNLERIGKAPDKNEFSMTPPTVNARYSPSLNDILFPAGILQPPFFNPAADDAINYGGIGAVIGHEMTHGFDDSGRRYDGAGNLRDWWTPADAAAYTARAKCVQDQFDSFVAVTNPDGTELHEKGALVLGESIADLGGMTVAYKAFQKTPEAKSGAQIDGYSPEQRFFLGYAQIWGANQTYEAARSRTLTDPHPLNNWRVIAPLSNTPAFAAAYSCKAGDMMVRPASERCQIW